MFYGVAWLYIGKGVGVWNYDTMDSNVLSLIVLTFFVPLVAYFATSVPEVIEVPVPLRAERREPTMYHPVLRHNVAIARLMALERL